jgi:glyoxylase-like metal-dependent hydrolase (beta-lactamase superfamily II)
MALPLEDSVSDIIGKAQRGLGLDDAALAKKIGVEPGELEAIKQIKGATPELVSKLARSLKLNPHALKALADGAYHPEAPLPKTGFFAATTKYGEMDVNAYLIWDPSTKQAAAFDTGADCQPLVDEIEKEGLNLTDIFLTHTHADHVADLDRLTEKVGGTIIIHVPEAEKMEGAVSFQAGATFPLGKLQVESRDTAGHSPGGTTYHIHGLDRPVAIVGDALFAGSAGGIRSDYPSALQRIRDHILSTQEGTILAPGHGPLTTTGQEKKSNPFFA